MHLKFFYVSRLKHNGAYCSKIRVLVNAFDLESNSTAKHMYNHYNVLYIELNGYSTETFQNDPEVNLMTLTPHLMY